MHPEHCLCLTCCEDRCLATVGKVDPPTRPSLVWCSDYDFEQVEHVLRDKSHFWRQIDPITYGEPRRSLRLHRAENGSIYAAFLFDLHIVWLLSNIKRCLFCLTEGHPKDFYREKLCARCLHYRFDTDHQPVQVRLPTHFDGIPSSTTFFCVVAGLASITRRIT